MKCIFCDIVAGKMPARTVYEDDQVVAFHDINPQAPTHVLIVPRAHIPRLQDAAEEQATLIGRLLLAANRVAERLGLDRSGYRVVINNGPDALQTVYHLHLHLLGGRRMSWPPG
ncbi:MAG: histidine triad nucleotide-binding protein [Calditrichaeota bacterium]|nr:MAG: histidine triad nucleotide-binding protein [Calditrichota bacterium]